MCVLKKSKLLSIFLMALFLWLIAYGCNDSGGGNDSSDSANSTATDKTWYKDADQDGYGDPHASLIQQSKPQGYVENAGDCDDYDEEVYPGALEQCDGKDNNCNGQLDENACAIKDIQIEGTITNLDEAEKFITKDSYLQIVSFPADGEMDYTTDSKGRLAFSSDLADIDIPSSDSFAIETTNLPPGKYVIAAQLLDPYGSGSDNSPILSKTKSKFAQITIPEDYVSPLVIKLGDVFIPVPEPESQTQNNNSTPSSPTGVSATDGAYADKIRVSWNPSAGATSYEIYRADSFMGAKSKIASTAGTFYDDASTPCNVDCYYWVKAKSSSGASEFFYNDLGYRKCPAPSAPQNVSASNVVFTDKIRVTWDASPGATSYDVYRSLSPSDSPIKIASTPGASYDDMTAACPNTYYYNVKAINSDGSSDFSASDSGTKVCSSNSATNDDDSPQTVDLPAPTAVSASDGTFLDKIQVTWSASAGATAYDVYRSFAECDEKIKIGTASTTLYDDQSLNITDKHTYYYWVKAKKTEGTSEFSQYDTGYQMRKPPKPTGVSASDGLYVGMIRVTWTPTPTATSYEIYRCRKWNCSTITKIGSPVGNSFDDTTIPCLTFDDSSEYYVYTVKAVNPAGISDFSDDDDGYGYQTIPNPDKISASDGTIDCCVKITWDTICDQCLPVKAEAYTYDIYRATSPEGVKTKIGSVAGGCCPTYSFRDSTATCPNVYYYWVKTVDSKGTSSCFFGNYDSGFCSGCAGD
jgi:fibronectin type 3 domain-containing protein